MKTLLAVVALCLASVALAPTAEADVPVECMPVYSQTELAGGYWLVRRDSCSAQVYQCPEGSSPPGTYGTTCQEVQLFTASSAPPPPNCIQIYQEFNFGPVRIVRSGCDSNVYVCGQNIKAAPGGFDAKRCPPTLPPIECSDIYARHEVGPVAVVMTSGCSGHVEVCDDTLPRVDVSCVVAVETSSPYCLPYQHEVEAGPVTVIHGGCGSSATICGDGAAAYLTAKPDPNGFVQCTWESTGLVGPVV